MHGGHLGADEDAATGFDNWRKCIDGLDLPVPLLIENTAGGDNAMARRLEAIARLWDAIGPASGGDNVGFCLDTCHAHAGGNDLGTVVDEVRAITGRIDLVHANDSRDEFDSGADRHANFGSGHIAGEALAEVVRAAGAPGRVRDARRPRGPAADIAWLRVAGRTELRRPLGYSGVAFGSPTMPAPCAPSRAPRPAIPSSVAGRGARASAIRSARSAATRSCSAVGRTTCVEAVTRKWPTTSVPRRTTTAV